MQVRTLFNSQRPINQMSSTLRYEPHAALSVLGEDALTAFSAQLDAARQEVLQDVELWNSGGDVPAEKLPLDAAYIDLPSHLLREFDDIGADSEIGRIQATAKRLQASVDRVVLLGIGGSYMGAKALFEALCHPYHNELSRDERKGIPRVYFEGNNVDSDALTSLLNMLPSESSASKDIANRWGTVVISKSGGTLETALAFRLCRQALEGYHGAGSQEVRDAIVAVTGQSGKLRNITNEQKFNSHFAIPDGVGGRFSIFCAVGMLPAAILGLDIVELLKGAAAMTERFRSAPLNDNPVLSYTGVCQLFEQHGLHTRILSTWGKKLESTGFWYDQLLSESLGKQERGATPITVVNTRDLHSRGQQHQEGTRNKIVTNLIVNNTAQPPLSIPTFDSDLDDLDRYASKTVADVLTAAINGTNQAYADDKRPTADIVLPALNEHTMGEFFQMMMLATSTEGRLIGINPYGQPGVETYKKNTIQLLNG
jgi:glucose-6-phosphate isomerase